MNFPPSLNVNQYILLFFRPLFRWVFQLYFHFDQTKIHIQHSISLHWQTWTPYTLIHMQHKQIKRIRANAEASARHYWIQHSFVDFSPYSSSSLCFAHVCVPVGRCNRLAWHRTHTCTLSCMSSSLCVRAWVLYVIVSMVEDLQEFAVNISFVFLRIVAPNLRYMR